MDRSRHPSTPNSNYVKADDAVNEFILRLSIIQFYLFILPFCFVSFVFLRYPSRPASHSFARPAKSARTVIAARVPSSMAPSMKLRHPKAQSEQAKTMLRSLALISFKCVDSKPGAGKNLQQSPKVRKMRALKEKEK